jgi:hypothetical protein
VQKGHAHCGSHRPAWLLWPRGSAVPVPAAQRYHNRIDSGRSRLASTSAIRRLLMSASPLLHLHGVSLLLQISVPLQERTRIGRRDWSGLASVNDCLPIGKFHVPMDSLENTQESPQHTHDECRSLSHPLATELAPGVAHRRRRRVLRQRRRRSLQQGRREWLRQRRRRRSVGARIRPGWRGVHRIEPLGVLGVAHLVDTPPS